MPTIVRGVAGNSDEIFDANVRAVEEGGHSIAAWHDGFGTPLALRSADGEPNNIWGTFFSRPWPTQVPGHQLSFGMTEQGWTLQWRSNRDGVELVRVKLGALGPTVVATPAISDLVDFVQAYDPSTETLSLLIEAPPGHRSIVLAPSVDGPMD